MNTATLLIGIVVLIGVAGWWQGHQERRVQDGLIDLLMNHGMTDCKVQAVHLPASALFDSALRARATVSHDSAPGRTLGVDLQIDGRLFGEQPVRLQLDPPAVDALRSLGC